MASVRSDMTWWWRFAAQLLAALPLVVGFVLPELRGVAAAVPTITGGGDVFHALPGERLADARFFAQANPAGRPPAVLGISVPESALDGMHARGILTINQTTGDYEFSNFGALNRVATFFNLE